MKITSLQKNQAIDYAVFQGSNAKDGEKLTRTATAVFEFIDELMLRQQAEDTVTKVRGSWDVPGFDVCVDAEFNRLKKEAKSNPRSDGLVTNDDGIRFFRGLIYAVILSVPLWAIIGGALFLIYTLIQRFI